MDENVVIPQEANQVLAYCNNNLEAYYPIPLAKRNAESLQHKFAVFSDVHCNTVQGQKHLANALEVMENEGVEYIIISGDLGETAAEYGQYRDACIESSFDGLIFSCIGNHDQKDAARENFKQYAVYDGGAKQFVTLANGESYFANSYSGSLPVEFFYSDLENGNTNYYYVTIADNMYFFMDQMLDTTGSTTTMDNFSEKQLDLLENALLKYSGDHTGDDDFAYAKYNLNLVEHAPIEQLKVGDTFTPRYGGQILLSYKYKNNQRLVNLLLEYTEMNFFTGHTHVEFDVGINYLDKYYDEEGALTNIDTAHMFHVSSLAQPRWYKSNGSMTMINDYSAGSECYVGYQYSSNIVLEGHSLKEYIENKTTYDPNDYINHTYARFSYIVPTGVNSHSKLSEIVDSGLRGDDIYYARNYSFSVSPDTYSLVSFDYYLSNSGTIALCVIGSEGNKYFGYFNFNKNGPVSSYAGITSELLSDNYIHVVIDLTAVQITNSQGNRNNAPEATRQLFIRGDWSTGVGCIDNIVFDFKSGDEPVIRGDLVQAGSNGTFTFARNSYAKVEFDYKITSASGTYFNFAILDSTSENWGKFYGYFEVSTSGISTNGVTSTPSAAGDGYQHITAIISQLNKSGSAWNLNAAPDAFDAIFIRGNWSNASVYIDNVVVTL